MRSTSADTLDALDQMFTAGEIDKKLHLEARSGILSYCRAAGKKPSKLNADIVELLDRMDATSALKAGFLPRRWSNLKSLLRRTLNLVGNPTKRARRDAPLAPVWESLLTNCHDRDVQCRLRPFAGFCTDHNISPAQVDETTLEAYAWEVHAISRSQNPTDRIKKVRRCWNDLVKQFPEQLTFRAQTWTNPRTWAQPLTDMPRSFQDEIALLKKARSPETFEEVFRCRPLKNAKAVNDQCATIMRIVAAMRMNGHALSKITSLRYIVQPEHFEATIRRLKQQTGAKDLRQLGSYVSVLHWLGETWVRLSDTKMRKLATAIQVVGRRRAEIADSSLEVLDQLDNPVKRERAKKLGDTVFAEFHAKGDTATRKDAAAFREALYWELGLTTGWRPRSRARINVEEDIHWRGAQGKRNCNTDGTEGIRKNGIATPGGASPHNLADSAILHRPCTEVVVHRRR